jgi:hypothetical protein
MGRLKVSYKRFCVRGTLVVLIEAEAIVPREISKAARVFKLTTVEVDCLRRLILFPPEAKSRNFPTGERGDFRLREDDDSGRTGVVG